MVDYLLRSLPRFRGKRRLARILLAHKIRTGLDLMVTGKHGTVYRLPNFKENIGFEILINGIYEPETVDFICRQVKPQGVFLDIGANIGAICIPVSKRRTDIFVVGVEASPWIYEYLQSNVRLNGIQRIDLINKAISDRSGGKVAFFSPKEKFGKGSLAPAFTEDAVEVETTTLSELNETIGTRAIDFIKMDIEGFESLAFRGGNEWLRSPQAPNILFEFVDWAEEIAGEKPGSSQELLLDHGFSLYPLVNGCLLSRLEEPLTKGACLIFATKSVLAV